MHKRTSTIGEALLAIAALAGFVVLAGLGRLQAMEDLWGYAGVLAVTLVFYAGLLLCRAIFTFMIGGDEFWWEKYKDEERKKKS